MTVAWMLYAMVVGTLLAAAAHAADRAARALRLPRRGAWLLAMAGTLALPLLARTMARDAERPAAAQAVRAPAILITAGATVARTGAPLGAIAGAAWLASSALAALLLVRALLLLHRRRRGWTLRQVHGVSLLVAPDAGPAVVGLRRMHVVLPEWALELDERLLAVMLRHEAEHVAARDPLLLLGAALALVLMPWNAALWWQARRLRLAIELDCDARVLRAHGDVERYGLLLLAVAQRRQRPMPLFSPALLEPVSLLERRITAMTARPTRRPWVVAAGGTAITAVALFVACSAPAPSATRDAAPTPAVVAADSEMSSVRQLAPSPVVEPQPATRAAQVPVVEQADTRAARTRVRQRDAAREARRGDAADLERKVARELAQPAGPTLMPEGTTYREFQVEKPVLAATNDAQPRYPEELKAAKVEGEVLAQFVVDTSGLVLPGSLKVLRSSHGQFTDAVRDALPRMRFVAAEVGGRKVRQLVQQPFVFALPR